MGDQSVGVWVQVADGDLVRSDAIITLGCQDGVVSATLAGGVSFRLAGPGCPPDFHQQLLAEIAESRLLDGGRYTVIITGHADKGQPPEWTTARLSRAPRDDQPAQHCAATPRAVPRPG